MNKVILMGRLTADPEISQTPQGLSVCHFSIAVDRPFNKNNNGNPNEPTADFFRITAWRSTADFVARYFVKGKPIIVEGSIRNNNYNDKNGITHYTCDITANSVSFCLSDSTRVNGSGNYNQGAYNNTYQQGNFGNNGYQNTYGNYGNYGNNSYNGYNNYNQGGFNQMPPQPNNNYYQQPQPVQYQQPMNNPVNNNVTAQPTPPTQNAQNPDADLDIGNLSDYETPDFEKILSDGDIPF